MPTKFLYIIQLLRLDKPIGTFLLFYPCAFGFFLAGGNFSNFYYLLLFFIGSLSMRSAGCIINDIVDKDLDALVKRTKTRPLANNNLSVNAAIIILLILLLTGLIVLVQLSKAAVFIAFSGFLLVLIYPFCKRITYWPQIVLGINFNIGLLVAYVQVSQKLDIVALFAYLACIFWTIGYDTIYAFCDLDDDKKYGIKSSARYIEKRNPKIWLFFFYTAFILLMIYSSGGLFNNFYLMSLTYLLAYLFLIKQILILDFANSRNFLKSFLDNFWVGLILIAGMFFNLLFN